MKQRDSNPDTGTEILMFIFAGVVIFFFLMMGGKVNMTTPFDQALM